MINLSAVIITLNEEKNIERCINSLKNVADEILVVDSSSTDNTVPIAQALGARVIFQDFLGFVQQRVFATDAAKHDWVFSIDADEVLSKELEQSILAVKANPTYKYYQLTRLTNYCGKWIKHCGWYPDKKIRLFDRTAGAWKGEMIHEYWKEHADSGKLGILRGDLLHYSFNSISDHIKQIEKFTEISALAEAKSGKTCSIWKVWLGPKWTFIKAYIIRLGFLDGYYGYLVCKFSAYASMIKYSKIRAYSKQHH